MDFTFSPEQEQLRDTVRSYLAREGGHELVRRAVDDGGRVPERLWAQVVELGWAGLLVPDELGGAGLGMVDLVVVQEELGRRAFPGPFLSSAVQATLTLRRLDDRQLLRTLAYGSARGTLALEELGEVPAPTLGGSGSGGGAGAHRPAGGDPLASITTQAVRDQRHEGRWLLDGLKPVVLDGDTADWALVVARDERHRLATFLVDEPEAEPVPGLDVTRRLTRLELCQRPARRIGPPGDQTELLRRVVDDIAVALCAETVGACEAALAMAVEYAKVRVQFGRPIGSFQAIRHKIVDMLHNLELARVGTHYAAWTSEVDDPERAAAASMAKGFVGEAANMITAENIQVHGGVGFTWDVDCHLFFRRVKQNDLLCGRAAWHRQRVADLVLGPAS
ncbi:MAG TPA: acyl-CoA dehydrogenase family protein [Acidimicrobiales bacterium]|nr:acyl-CoA dehydrogenase family protein [Acidimicrobiales bacterium]